MTPTPQQLMDLPYAGMAENELRKAGLWQLTITDTERIEWMAENVSLMARDTRKQSWKFKTDNAMYDVDFLREDIDVASSFMDKEQWT